MVALSVRFAEFLPRGGDRGKGRVAGDRPQSSAIALSHLRLPSVQMR
ncbi:hypothetical protein HPC62_16245 [Thermoleptolyngbya sichuanensis A183]|uniref:Uncharacterized protein n=1 Tax=Thermoleptolyngbya sichuanensis A183 TaxID=2737172 RepID=A0A6M8BBQ3_9CYAN|nr:hypothetical protein [Thermoleptolyngbya sichuanensis]QKD83542.1 hypothetical protein HPC62_16245 [Thermoleptolyngbya sichuanensis A183]